MKTMQALASSRLFGSILLISGCCIGAGMLGLPILSALAGFKPSFVMFLLCWAFMTTTGLLLLEVTLWFPDDVNIISMSSQTLGKVGKAIAWGTFLFLFYCILVAYVAGSGMMIVDFLQQYAHIQIAPWIGSLLCTLLLGGMLYAGTHITDLFNRVLMLGLIGTYVALVILGCPYIDHERLSHQDWRYAPLAIPTMILSFGFHNLVPSIATYLHRNRRQLTLAILMGSLIPLGIYLIWEALVLSLIPLEGEHSFRTVLNEGQLVTQALKAASGSFWVVNVTEGFAFFAIVTSFIGVGLSFVDFLADGCKIPKDNSLGKLLLCFLVLFPPYIFAFLYPHVFLTALNYAGGIGAVLLFGILPAVMVWVGRYQKKLGTKPLVPGGKVVLALIILFSLAVMALQIVDVEII